MTNDEMFENFFEKLGIDAPRCIICGNPIPMERIKEFPKTKFCKTECTLKWLASHPEIPEKK